MRPLRCSPFALLVAALHAALPGLSISADNPRSDAAPGQPRALPSSTEATVLTPSATCTRPRPLVATRLELTRFVWPVGFQLISFDENAQSLLSRWEAAARDLEPVSRHERKRLLAVHHPGRSAHELDLACEFRGPIDAAALAGRYDWEAPAFTPRHIELAAEPRDLTERLFFRRFTVHLDRDTFRPVLIQFTNGTGEKSLPMALETMLCLEARLARSARDPHDPGSEVIPAAASRPR